MVKFDKFFNDFFTVPNLSDMGEGGRINEMKMKIILQHDERDCGAACMAMIASYYGYKQSIQFFRRLTNTDKEGANIYGIIQAARKIGISAEALEGTADELKSCIENETIQLPIIAHVISDQGYFHFVIVYKIRNGTIYIVDPGKGKITYKSHNFFENWTGYIISFKNTSSLKKSNYKESNVRFLLSFLKGQYHKIILALLASAIIAILGIYAAFLFQTIMDNYVIPGKSGARSTINLLDKLINIIPIETTNISAVFCAVAMLYLVQSAVLLARSYLMIAISKSIETNIATSYYNHLTSVKVESLAMRQTGEYMSRFSDADDVRNAISDAALSLVLDTIMTIGCGSILYFQNKKLFIITVFVVVVNVIVALVYRKPVNKSNRRIMETNAIVQSYLKETIDGIDTIKATTSENKIQSNACAKIEDYIKALVHNCKIVASQEILANCVENIGKLIILWVGFSLALTGGISVGELLTYYALLAYFTEPIKNIVELQPSIQKAFIACDRLRDIFEMELDSLEEGKPVPNINEWKVSHVDFRYGNNNLVLSDISLSIHKGEKIAIVGESGCGKSTLAKLLLRFYEPEKGEIFCDNTPICELNLNEHRKSIAYVSQETFLFSDSIYANLCIGVDTISEEKMLEACKKSEIDDYIDKLPSKYDTQIEENGVNLSVGQRQRLGIARALLRSPQLFIFDEATSSLDSLTETNIKKSVLYNKDFTCLIIAHRLSVTKECDRIYVMNQGKIVEAGTHNELLDRKGKYWELYTRQ